MSGHRFEGESERRRARLGSSPGGLLGSKKEVARSSALRPTRRCLEEEDKGNFAKGPLDVGVFQKT
jgi:hypothetical protein